MDIIYHTINCSRILRDFHHPRFNKIKYITEIVREEKNRYKQHMRPGRGLIFWIQKEFLIEMISDCAFSNLRLLIQRLS